jgi:hypothetical protein
LISHQPKQSYCVLSHVSSRSPELQLRSAAPTTWQTVPVMKPALQLYHICYELDGIWIWIVQVVLRLGGKAARR